ncbi:MAG: GNAT family N-acetyltransferase [Bifidobacteriaceae bacterium]|jgi:ribosomal protein S18 acetylase RimI-like enzyme|nr:GNAT family N-acetyltransferase [Bifidobacteriaceae bacterium]
MAGMRSGYSRSIAERVRAPRHPELPSPHLELEWRRLAPTDAGQLQALIREADEAEGAVIDSVADVLVDLIVRDEYASLDAIGGFDRAGVLRAYAAVHLWPVGDIANVVFYGATDPTWVGRGIGRALLAWQEGRGRQLLARVPGAGMAQLSSYVEEAAADRRRLLVAAGFSPLRTYLKMRRDLAAPIPEPEFPPGFVIKNASDVSEAAVRHAHTQGAREVWGEGPLTPAAWHRRWQQYRREWSFAVLDPSEGSEAVVGYLLSMPQVEALSPARRTEGAIHRLSVIPTHRGRGIGRGLAITALRAFAESGLRFGSIIVDPENTNSGFALYDDLGFAPTTRAIVYGVTV